VNEEQFYTYRYGGGTQCSSAFDSINQQFENRYPPNKFNIYVFYFTDGDNWDNDNDKVVNIIKEKMPESVVNLVGITQVCSYSYKNSVKEFVDQKIESGEMKKNKIKTANIGPEKTDSGWGNPKISEEERNVMIIDAIKTLLANE
jgi:uncharacterized sporulation protein YeaH/YhbH (DUF444 family)